MTETDVVRLFKCLADRSRLQILRSLAIEDMYVERLAQRLGITPSTVSFHLKKLAEAGVVSSYKSQYYMMYSLKREIFHTAIIDIISERSDEEELHKQRDEAYRKKVIDAFFEYGRLKAIPAQQKKERIILEEIVQAFDTDRTYTEAEVNAILNRYYDDHCTLRRDMIGEKLMERQDGVYRRIQ